MLPEKLYLLKNPKLFFLILVFIFSIILFVGIRFELPDYYLNRELADEIAQSVTKDISSATKHLVNNAHKFWNIIFILWGNLIALFIYCFIFRINSFKDMFCPFLFLNKKIIYIFVNLSYFLFAYCFVNAAMVEVFKYVYNSGSDSFSIPFFGYVSYVVFGALIYFPVANFITFIVYNTKIKNWFYYFVLSFALIFVVNRFIPFYQIQFSYYSIFLYLCLFSFIAFFISSFITLKNKKSCDNGTVENK